MLGVGVRKSGHPLKLNMIRQEPVYPWREHASCVYRLIDLMRLEYSLIFRSKWAIEPIKPSQERIGNPSFRFYFRKLIFLEIQKTPVVLGNLPQRGLFLLTFRWKAPTLAQVRNFCPQTKDLKKIALSVLYEFAGAPFPFLLEALTSFLSSCKWTICTCPVPSWA